MLKIYTEHQFLTPENRRRVFPLLFDLFYLPNEKAMVNFSIEDSISEADVAIFPVDVISFMKNDKSNFLNIWFEKISNYNIPIWVYAAGDFGCSIDRPNVSTFRFGGFKSKLQALSHIMPSFLVDPYKSVVKNDFFVLPKHKRPNIGFVGNANGSLIKFCKEYILYARRNLVNTIVKNPEDYHPFYPSGWKRSQLLKKISKEDKLKSNFILRNKYRGRDKNAGSEEDSTIEFFNNIQNNLYVFCLRGNGNFSVRFYEALIMGRIPVLIDTDVKLPLEDQVDWNKHCLVVSENSIIRDLIIFHASKTEFEIKEVQNSNRNLMLEKLNRVDYFIQISNEYLKKK